MLELFESLILGTSPEDAANKKMEIMGNFSFYVEPSIVGFQGFHTSTVVVTVYEDPSKRKPLQFTVKWSKILNSEPYEMENYQERHYHFTPSDIDLKVRAAITCQDPKFPGVAYLYIGPIQMDTTLCPELEGMVMNTKGSFRVQVLARDNVPLRPNHSVVRIDKPYLTINFDPVLEECALGSSDVAAYLPLEINFESEHHLKVRIDNYSTTVVIIVYKEEGRKDHRLALQFDSREQRDAFYIFLRLLRSIKTSFLDRLFAEYDILINAPWSFLHLDLDFDEDDPEDKLSFYQILRTDNIREHLRDLLRMKIELSHENLTLTDSLVVLEADLSECVKQFRELLAEGRSGKPVRNLNKYEKSRSALGELSMSILDDIKKGDKSSLSPKKKEEKLPTKEELEEEIKKVKEVNAKIKKEIESLKQGGSAQEPSESSFLKVGASDKEIGCESINSEKKSTCVFSCSKV